MNKNRVEFDSTVILNKSHRDFGRVQYEAMLRHPYPEGVSGCPLGRSPISCEDAYNDLRKRILVANNVDIGPLED